ncbi:peroxiredoxin [Pirellulales bacterium]|nr:peroxiredoxin [Pirellulales bacterium]
MQKLFRGLAAGLITVISVTTVEARETRAPLRVGDEAPSFQAMSDQGPEGKPVLWKSKDRVGKKILVVYFYPADMTGGCTKQACGYRDALKTLKRRDVEVVGVSGDTVENHRVFRSQHELSFTLLADPDGKVADAFGVKRGEGDSIQRVVEGQEITLTRGVSAARWTFVIGPENTILHVDRQVNPAKDPAAALKVIEGIPELKPERNKESAP